MHYFSGRSTSTGIMAILMCLLLLLNLTTALPQEITTPQNDTIPQDVTTPPDDTEAEPGFSWADISYPGDISLVGTGGFCVKGYNQRNFRGDWLEACCFDTCCRFSEWVMFNLRSAITTDTPDWGVTLWKNQYCDGNPATESVWISTRGRYSLQPGGYYSMSLS